MRNNTISSDHRPKILIFAPREEPPEVSQGLRKAGCKVAFGDSRWQLPGGQYEAAFIASARDAVALMGTSIRETPISRRILEASPQLRIVAKYSVGVDDVDLEAATELGVLVCNAPTEPNCFGVAKSTIAMMLTMLKKLRERDGDIRAGRWREQNIVARYVGSRENDGCPGVILGLVGLGRIASRVADLLAPWRMRIVGYDPYVDPMHFPLHRVEAIDYESLLRESDVVSFHVPLTKETQHMLSDKQIELMKPSAIVINTARGKIIDESAIARAICSGRIAGAAIDAFEQEPLPDFSPLRTLGDRVLLTPHSAAVTDGGELRAGVAVALKAVLEALCGRPPSNVCNSQAIPLWKERFGSANLTLV